MVLIRSIFLSNSDGEFVNIFFACFLFRHFIKKNPIINKKENLNLKKMCYAYHFLNIEPNLNIFLKIYLTKIFIIDKDNPHMLNFSSDSNAHI